MVRTANGVCRAQSVLPIPCTAALQVRTHAIVIGRLTTAGTRCTQPQSALVIVQSVLDRKCKGRRRRLARRNSRRGRRRRCWVGSAVGWGSACGRRARWGSGGPGSGLSSVRNALHQGRPGMYVGPPSCAQRAATDKASALGAHQHARGQPANAWPQQMYQLPTARRLHSDVIDAAQGAAARVGCQRRGLCTQRRECLANCMLHGS